MKLNIALAVTGLCIIILSIMAYNTEKVYPSVIEAEKKWYTEVCIDGVTYISIRKSFSVKLGTDSKVVLCEV
jgi:hypothetical protein